MMICPEQPRRLTPPAKSARSCRTGGAMRMALVLSPLLAGCVAAPVPAAASAPVEGWGYLHAQCMQERVAEPRNICEAGLEDEPVLAIIVSNIVRFDSKSF